MYQIKYLLTDMESIITLFLVIYAIPMNHHPPLCSLYFVNGHDRDRLLVGRRIGSLDVGLAAAFICALPLNLQKC